MKPPMTGEEIPSERGWGSIGRASIIVILDIGRLWRRRHGHTRQLWRVPDFDKVGDIHLEPTSRVVTFFVTTRPKREQNRLRHEL